MGFLFVIIIIIVSAVLYFKTKRAEEASRSKQASNRTHSSAPAPRIDPSVVEKIVFLESVAISLAYNKNPHLKNNGINHGFIRCEAGELGNTSFVEFYATTINIFSGENELKAFLECKTLENAQRFLNAAGFQSVKADQFLKYAEIADTRFDSTGRLLARHSIRLPSGSGRLYYERLQKEFRQKWPALPFAYENVEIDLSV